MDKFDIIQPDEAPIPTRKIHTLVIHHSASARSTSAETIEQWHNKRGFNGIGYHFVVRDNGDIQVGRSIEKTPAAQKGKNTGTIAICCVGNFSETKANEPYHPQFLALARLVNHYVANILKLQVKGHRELTATECPGKHIDLDIMRAYFKKVGELKL